jgi:hypothetical protein
VSCVCRFTLCGLQPDRICRLYVANMSRRLVLPDLSRAHLGRCERWRAADTTCFSKAAATGNDVEPPHHMPADR